MVSQNFLLKIFSRAVDLGGVYTEYLHFGGGPDGIGRKWGGSASGARRAQNWYTPPPLDVFDTFPNKVELQGNIGVEKIVNTTKTPKMFS